MAKLPQTVSYKPRDFWANVLFSGESKYNLFGCDGKEIILGKLNREFEPKNLLPTAKHGSGSIMVWSCISASEVGKLQFVGTNMDRFVQFTHIEKILLL